MLILFGFTVIIIVLIKISNTRNKDSKKASDEFWKKEHDSHFVPRKDISKLDYLTIEYSKLPFCYWMPGTDGKPVSLANGTSDSTFSEGMRENADSFAEGISDVTFSDVSADLDNFLGQNQKVQNEIFTTRVESRKQEMPPEAVSELPDFSTGFSLKKTGNSSYEDAYNESFPDGTHQGTDMAPMQEELSATEFDICSLSEKRILNLSGLTNVDLRTTYGTANLDPLSAADQNFTNLIRALQKWGNLLVSSGNLPDAVTVLSYAVSIGSDITGTYALLGRLYKGMDEYEKINELKASAEKLNTLLKPSIIKDLDSLMEVSEALKDILE